MPWYKGQTILEHEALEPADVYERDKHVFLQTGFELAEESTTLEDMPVNCTEIIY
jgi:hypothetical protein